MQIQAVQLHEIRIPLNFQFRQSNNPGATRSLSAVVELYTSEGIRGVGESCPRTYVTGETFGDVARDLKTLSGELLQETIGSIDDLQKNLKNWAARGVGASTRCAIELAWLDAWSRKQNCSLKTLLDVRYEGVLGYSMVLPLVNGETLAKLLNRLTQFHPPAIKLKVDQNHGENIKKIELIREVFGSDIPVRIDANSSWSLEDAKRYIPELMEHGVHSFEQPLAAPRLEEMKILTRLYGSHVSIMADESLLSPENAAYLLQNRVCNHFNLKISKLGGFLASLEIYRLAEQFGVPCQLGAHFGETSLLTSAAAILAAKVEGNLSACEGALGEFLLSGDICSVCLQHDINGSLSLKQLWKFPGWAGDILSGELQKFTVRSQKFSRQEKTY